MAGGIVSFMLEMNNGVVSNTSDLAPEAFKELLEDPSDGKRICLVYVPADGSGIKILRKSDNKTIAEIAVKVDEFIASKLKEKSTVDVLCSNFKTEDARTSNSETISNIERDLQGSENIRMIIDELYNDYKIDPMDYEAIQFRSNSPLGLLLSGDVSGF